MENHVCISKFHACLRATRAECSVSSFILQCSLNCKTSQLPNMELSFQLLPIIPELLTARDSINPPLCTERCRQCNYFSAGGTVCVPSVLPRYTVNSQAACCLQEVPSPAQAGLTPRPASGLTSLALDTCSAVCTPLVQDSHRGSLAFAPVSHFPWLLPGWGPPYVTGSCSTARWSV